MQHASVSRCGAERKDGSPLQVTEQSGVWESKGACLQFAPAGGAALLSPFLPCCSMCIDCAPPSTAAYAPLKVVRSILDDIGQDELLGVLEQCFVEVGCAGGGRLMGGVGGGG